ncbi:mpv17-like protein [Tiliqua scincoides]|uniref:mpv17-like protein n=1 Tax=Tiliqua scincoides TaxID=71010 RepID=UPI003461E1EB
MAGGSSAAAGGAPSLRALPPSPGRSTLAGLTTVPSNSARAHQGDARARRGPRRPPYRAILVRILTTTLRATSFRGRCTLCGLRGALLSTAGHLFPGRGPLRRLRGALLLLAGRPRSARARPAQPRAGGGRAESRLPACQRAMGAGRWARRARWPGNVLLYGALFAAGDAAQQRLRGGRADWAQTRRVALVALAFHGHFSFFWLRALERLLPGRAPRAVLAKVLCDQLLGAPVAVLAFYTGMSLLQGKEDIFSDCRQKFWNTYKTGLMYWPFVQLSNFSLVPVHLRTAYTGLCGFIWAAFLCFSQQSGDGTAKSVFLLFRGERSSADEKSPEK